MKIVLIGLRGSGKTKIGKILSGKLKLPLIDLDKEIEKTEKCPIAYLVKKRGWEYFRKKEKATVKKFGSKKNTIISCGGGTIIDPTNRKILKKDGTVIYLKRSPETCFKYIKNKRTRPPLSGQKDLLKDLKQTYKDRKKIYEETADIVLKRTNDLVKDTKNLLLSIPSIHY